MSEHDNPTPEQIAAAAQELRKPPTFADFLDLHRPLRDAVHSYRIVIGSNASPTQLSRARDRVNAEADRAGLKW